jgi:hypothetical protein
MANYWRTRQMQKIKNAKIRTNLTFVILFIPAPKWTIDQLKRILQTHRRVEGGRHEAVGTEDAGIWRPF